MDVSPKITDENRKLPVAVDFLEDDYPCTVILIDDVDSSTSEKKSVEQPPQETKQETPREEPQNKQDSQAEIQSDHHEQSSSASLENINLAVIGAGGVL